MGYLNSLNNTPNFTPFMAPVELACLAGREGKWNKRCLDSYSRRCGTRRIVTFAAQDITLEAVISALIPVFSQDLVKTLCRAPLTGRFKFRCLMPLQQSLFKTT